MYSFSHLLNFKYWFSEPPFLGAPALWAMVIIFGLMIVATIGLAILSQKGRFDQFLRRGFKKMANLLGWMGVLAFILLFFRYEFVPLLSRRFMFLLWAMGFITWLVFVLKYLLMKMPKLQQERQAKERLKKYLP